MNLALLLMLTASGGYTAVPAAAATPWQAQVGVQHLSVAKDSTLARAEKALVRGAYDEAIALYRRHLETGEDTYDAQFGLARALSYSGRRAEAVDLLTEMLRRHPGNPDVLVIRGYAYLHMGRLDDAISDFGQVAEDVPGYADAWRGLGTAYLRRRQPAHAVEVFSRWAEARPDDPEPLLERARAYASMRQFAAARADLHAARRLGADAAAASELSRRLNRRTQAHTTSRSLTARTGYDFESFGGARAAWQQYLISLAYDAEQAVLMGSYYRSTRFGLWSDALAADAYVDIWPKAYVHARGLFGLDDRIHPDVDLWVELFQDVGDGWQPFTAFRYIAYPEARAYVGQIGAVKYLGHWYLRGTTSAIRAEGLVRGSVQFTARRYLRTVDSFLEGRAGYGHQIVSMSPERHFDVGSSYAASIRVQHYLTPQFGLSVGGTYTNADLLPSRGGLSILVMHRW